MVGASQELQDVAMAALVKYPSILSKALTEVSESYFSKPSYQLIYKCLRDYYEKTLLLPSKLELALAIKKVHDPAKYGDLHDVYNSVDFLFNSDLNSEDYAFDSVLDFVRRVKGERALEKFINSFDGKNLDLDRVLDDLSNALTVNFSKTSVYNLADISKVKEIRDKALGDRDNPVLMKFFIDALNDAMLFKGLTPGMLCAVVAPPSKGKSMLLVNQGVATAQQGYNVLHIILGDLSEYDLLLRYLSCAKGISVNKIHELSDEELQKFIQGVNLSGFLSKVDFAVYNVGVLTVTQLIEEINTLQKQNRKHYHTIIVDYDENLAQTEDDMYKGAGTIYNKLAMYARSNKSLVFIASQPKTEYYSYEIIPQEGMAESSKKQKICDMILTMARPYKTSHVGTLFVAKNRRGTENLVYRIDFQGDKSRIIHITEDEYVKRKQQDKGEGHG